MEWLKTKILYIAWLQSLAAMLGSLYFSELRHLAPCLLCWYQRILMYPLVLVIMIGILRKDKGIYLYVLPMSILGAIIAFYHILLQNGILLGNIIAPCILGVSCATKYTTYLGFITIPIMSFAAFLLITFCMIIFRNNQK